MPSFDIKIDSNADEVARLMSDVGDRVVHQSRVAAANGTMRQVLTRVKADVNAATGVPKGVLGKRMKLHRVTKQKRSSRLFVGIVPVPAIKLGARQLKKGVSHAGRGGRVKLPGAFIANARSGGPHVFQRRGAARLPIDKQTVLIGTAAISSAKKQMASFAPGKFRELFRSQFEFRTQRELNKRRL